MMKLLLLNYSYLRQISSEVHVGVVVSKTDILGEVGQLLFITGQLSSVVNRDDNGGVLSDLITLRSNVLGFLDNPGIEVVLGNDFVERRQNDALCLGVLKNGSDESLDELSLVNVDTGPCGGRQEGLVVLGAQQDSVQKSNFLAELADGVRVHGAFRLNQTSLYGAYVVLDENGVLVLLDIALDVIGGTKDLQLLVRDWLGNLLQQQDDILLLAQQILISYGETRQCIITRSHFSSRVLRDDNIYTQYSTMQSLSIR